MTPNFNIYQFLQALAVGGQTANTNMKTPIRKLFTRNNTKTIKGLKLGISTLVLHFASAKRSGYNVCAWATKECIKFCLDESGRAKLPSARNARVQRTRLYFENRDWFLTQLRKEIEAHIKNCARKNLICAVRINGTSDLPELAIQMANEFPSVTFYDYTKSIEHALSETLPINLTVAFSQSESNAMQCRTVLANGGMVASVFKDKDSLPKKHLGYEVVDGTEHDAIFTYPKPCVIGLYALGKLQNAQSEFVQ